MDRHSEIVHDSVREGRDPKTRLLILILSTLAVLSLVAALIAVWYGWSKSRESAISGAKLGEQVRLACANPEVRKDLGDICGHAKEVAEGQDPEIQDSEIDDPEIQERELQEPEIQDPEKGNPEPNDPDPNDPESQDAEVQDAEAQEAEEQDAEVDDSDPNDPDPTDDPDPNDPENQDPEVDDPDPASPYTFSFTFTVPGNGNQPGTTYTVTCNSGTGNCTVS